MGRNDDQIRWFRETNTQWKTKPHRGYTGTINVGAGANPYQLVITGPGGSTSTYPTYRRAKSAFRQFLFTKPVAA